MASRGRKIGAVDMKPRANFTACWTVVDGVVVSGIGFSDLARKLDIPIHSLHSAWARARPRGQSEFLASGYVVHVGPCPESDHAPAPPVARPVGVVLMPHPCTHRLGYVEVWL
jgi:hypothetical protein